MWVMKNLHTYRQHLQPSGQHKAQNQGNHKASYDLPQMIDLAPLEAAWRGLFVVFQALLDQGRYSRIEAGSRDIHRALKSLIGAATHNDRLARKLDMLASPTWRARVLKDLGGEAVLARWERIMAKRHKIAVFGDTPRAHASPAQRLARAANLKKAKLALWRKRFQAECRAKRKYRSFERPNPKTLVDRVKVDMEGQFRLAALKRAPLKHGEIKRSKQTVKPAVKDAPKAEMKRVTKTKVYYTQIDPIEIYPLEFRAAEMINPCEDGRVEGLETKEVKASSVSHCSVVRKGGGDRSPIYPKVANPFETPEPVPPDKG